MKRKKKRQCKLETVMYTTTTSTANGSRTLRIEVMPPDAILRTEKTIGDMMYAPLTCWERLVAFGFRARRVTVGLLRRMLETGALRRVK